MQISADNTQETNGISTYRGEWRRMGSRGWVATVALEDPGGSGSRTCRQVWPPSHPPALHPLLPLAPAVDSTAVAAAVVVVAAAVAVAVAAAADDACGGGDYCLAGECELIQSAIGEKDRFLT